MPDSSLPLVTVITVTYQLVEGNRSQHFRTCVESVQRQTYPAIEHLVIDGGSMDGTVELIREFEGKGGLSYISEPDKGIYDAMNKGIRMAKGKYIAFLNSDDFWHDAEGVARSVELLEKAHADFSYAPRVCVNQEGEREYEEYPQIGSFAYAMPFCHQTMFTRTELLRELGGFRCDKYTCAADYDLVVRLMLSGAKPVYVSLNFTCFRLGGFSIERMDLSRSEVELIVKEHFGAYMDSTADMSWLWEPSPKVPVELLRSLDALVHPSVVAQLHGYALGPWCDEYHISAGRPAETPQWGLKPETPQIEPPAETPQIEQPAETPRIEPPAETPWWRQNTETRSTKSTWRLFHILPLFSVTKKGASARIYLFGSLLYLMKIKKSYDDVYISLFGIIPLLKIKIRHD